MKEELKVIREKAIKLAVAILKITNRQSCIFTEHDVRYVIIDDDITISVKFEVSGSWGTEWDDYVTMSLEDVEGDFDSSIEKYRLKEKEKLEDLKRRLEDKKIQEKILEEQHEIEEYKRLQAKFGN